MIESVIFAVLFTALSCETYRILQTASYRPRRGYWKVFLTPYYITLVVLQALSVVFSQYRYWLILPYFAAALLWILLKRKSRLKFTKRVIRMIFVNFVILLALCYFVGICFWTIFIPVIVLLSWCICLPIDHYINSRYLIKARRKLDSSKVKVIAITGSYGKTSVKDCLATLLSDSLAPTGSCNTPLGIASFINAADLSGKKYLILEFGARQSGDIKELCALFKPSYGIVTGVCAQHLSTFKNLNNVVSTKRELVECISENGFCILNGQDELVRDFLPYGVCRKFLSDCDLQVNLVDVNYDGSTVEVAYNDEITRVHIPQITPHYTDILSMCIQLCIRINQDLSTTMNNIVSLKQTKHRMEMIYNGFFYILDDSYNASIVGVESCAKTLKYFKCRKVAICQGIVECGNLRRELNVRCGAILGEVCDFVIVTGKNSKFLMEGLAQTQCGVLKAKNLNNAVVKARGLVDNGILVFQNDLPDVVNI
ncbi:MAG: Mur ligase family protein [Corallococcus sp.]|nr:Mur ligase family protein [Corallococcus sp.]